MAEHITIKVSTEELQSASSQVQTSLSKMRESFAVIEQAVNRSGGYWKGEAADCHRRIYREMKQDAAEILNRVQEQTEDLQAIARGYEEGERAVKEMVSELPSDVLA